MAGRRCRCVLCRDDGDAHLLAVDGVLSQIVVDRRPVEDAWIGSVPPPEELQVAGVVELGRVQVLAAGDVEAGLRALAARPGTVVSACVLATRPQTQGCTIAIAAG